ncbi:MAG TPA: HAMP domain-containing histidine kinase [Gammaproteobacteria bacterium]|nr:HAMP domain-containing histidine kinase [Gammaproteobacteria bacterium]
MLSALAVAIGAAATHYFGPGITLPYLVMLLLATPALAVLFYPVLRHNLGSTLCAQNGDQAENRELERLKAEFVASMSHELRTPLNSIIGFTGIILQGMSGEINQRQRDQLERVLTSAKKLLSMISDVIEIAKIDSGATKPCLTNFFPKQAIQDSITDMRRENNHIFNEVDIEVDISPEMEFRTDAKKLVQCVLNLVVYIVEYANIENIKIAAGKTGQIATITIGTISPIPDRLPLERLVTSMQPQGGEPSCGVRTDNEIRMHLTKKIITSLPGGNLALGSNPDDGVLLCLELQA